MRSLFLALAAVCACASPALAADKRIYKIDSVIATQKGNMLTIQAKGAVQSGGWTKPRLHVIRKDDKSLVVEFLAAPPPPGMVVIEAMVPVSASTQVRAHGVAAVNALAEANEMTSQILH